MYLEKRNQRKMKTLQMRVKHPKMMRQINQRKKMIKSSNRYNIIKHGLFKNNKRDVEKW